MKRVVLTSFWIALVFGSFSGGLLNASAAFQLICPSSVTVDCDHDLTDLDQFGQAYVHGYGDPTPAPPPTVYFNLNSCGVGFIKRTWTVYDYGGYPHSCSQFIYVTGGGFSLYNISWPEDFITLDCNASLLPKDLPPGFDKPVIDDVGCGMPAIGYTDWAFDLGSSGCSKILRKWTVIDWCVFDPNSYYPKGIWQYTQLLKIKIMEKPDVTCPDEIIVSTPPHSCEGSVVNNLIATGIGFCGGDVTITNNSPIGSGGANASGFYPLGTTVVKFTANDQCGNSGQCVTKVVVRDMIHPSPVCYHGLSSTLGMESDGYYLDLVAEWFDRNSFDNCTPSEKLSFDVFPTRVDCDDVGEVEVVLTVTDESGNSDYCVTYIKITDNLGICPPEDSLVAGGSVKTVDGISIDNGFIFLSNEEGDFTKSVSIEDGHYYFSELKIGENYKIKPLCDADPLTGVSTFDILLLQMYISGLWSPDDPRDLISADVDFSGTIDVMDVAHIRNLVLGNTTGLPSGQSWRFVDAEYNFINRDLPYRDILPESIELFGFSESYLNLNFKAFKLGDINRSFKGNGPRSAEFRSEGFAVTFPVIAKPDPNGMEVLSFTASESLDLYGIQLGFKLPYRTSILQVESDVFNSSSIFYSMDDENNLRVSISGANLEKIEKGDVILEIITDEPVSGFTAVESFSNEVYKDLANPQPLDLLMLRPEEQNRENYFEPLVYPNPVKDFLNVDFNGSASEAGLLYSIYDLNGRLLVSGKRSSQESSHGFGISVSGFPAGVFVLKLDTGYEIANLRFLIVD